MEIKDLIRAARKERGWSQVRLAKELGVNKSAVAQWELGSTSPTHDNMTALRSVLSIPTKFQPSGSTPYSGEVVEDLDELALLRFWRSLSDEKRRVMIELLHIGRPNSV